MVAKMFAAAMTERNALTRLPRLLLSEAVLTSTVATSRERLHARWSAVRLLNSPQAGKQPSLGLTGKIYWQRAKPEGWEPPKPKTQIQHDPACPKCKGKGGSMQKGQGVGRVWQNCDCGREVSVAAA